MGGEETLTAAGDVPERSPTIPLSASEATNRAAPADVGRSASCSGRRSPAGTRSGRGHWLDPARRNRVGAPSAREGQARPSSPADRHSSTAPCRSTRQASVGGKARAGSARATGYRRERAVGAHAAAGFATGARALRTCRGPDSSRARARRAALLSGRLAARPCRGLAAASTLSERAGLALAPPSRVLPLGNLSAGSPWPMPALRRFRLARTLVKTRGRGSSSSAAAPGAALAARAAAAGRTRLSRRNGSSRARVRAVLVAGLGPPGPGDKLPFTGSFAPAPSSTAPEARLRREHNLGRPERPGRHFVRGNRPRRRPR